MKYQVFLNTNSYKSIIYKQTGNDCYILNYNGSIYRIRKKDFDNNSAYIHLNEDISGFIRNFPEHLLIDNYDTKRIRDIISNLSKKVNNSNELLLIN